MKHIVIIIYLLLFASFDLCAQSFNMNNTALANYLVRMYEDNPFEGARIVDDYDSARLICVLSLDGAAYPDEATLNRIASVKAMSIASRFLNGAEITSDTIIHTHDKSNGQTDTEIIENIRERSIGYVKSVEQLTNFKNKEGRTVFIFSTKEI